MSKKQKLFWVILVGTLFVLIYLLGGSIEQEVVVNYIQSYGALAPIVYTLMMALTFVLAPLSGTPLTFAGYFLFPNRFIMYSFIAAEISVVANFWIARKYGRNLVTKFVGKNNMKKIDQLTTNYGLKSLIFLRVFQGHLHDFISYAYGLTNINFSKYLITSIIAPIPWTLIWQFYILKRINNVADFTLWFALSLAPFFIVSALLAPKFLKKNNSKPPQQSEG